MHRTTFRRLFPTIAALTVLATLTVLTSCQTAALTHAPAVTADATLQPTPQTTGEPTPAPTLTLPRVCGGSTGSRLHYRRGGCASPANAGVYLTPNKILPHSRSKPRKRGGLPAGIGASVIRPEQAPQMRGGGSTEDPGGFQSDDDPRPANAGGLPPIRLRPRPVRWQAPQTRGSTVVHSILGQHVAARPANAGVYRRALHSRSARSGTPRKRGGLPSCTPFSVST